MADNPDTGQNAAIAAFSAAAIRKRMAEAEAQKMAEELRQQ